jgi:hypothetical protein
LPRNFPGSSASFGYFNSDCRSQKAAAEAKLAEPIEVSEPIRTNPISTPPWIICLRSGTSEESKRRTYSAFFNKVYVSSKWSVIMDHCEEQVFHPLKDYYQPSRDDRLARRAARH